MAVKDHSAQRRSQPAGSVVKAILLGDRCITPRRRGRMAHDLQGAYGYPHEGVYLFAEAHIEVLSILAQREGLRAGEEYGRDPLVGDAYRAIVAEVRAKGQATVRLVY